MNMFENPDNPTYAELVRANNLTGQEFSKTGDVVEKEGVYICMQCNEPLPDISIGEKLPSCPNCGKTLYFCVWFFSIW